MTEKALTENDGKGLERRIVEMRKMDRTGMIKQRTVAGLLGVEMNNPVRRFRYRRYPRHTYVYCRSRNIAARFLADAEAEGFTFGDGVPPTQKEYSDLYALHDDLTVSYTGRAGYLAFRSSAFGGNVVRIDYGKYVSGAGDWLIH